MRYFCLIFLLSCAVSAKEYSNVELYNPLCQKGYGSLKETTRSHNGKLCKEPAVATWVYKFCQGADGFTESRCAQQMWEPLDRLRRGDINKFNKGAAGLTGAEKSIKEIRDNYERALRQ